MVINQVKIYEKEGFLARRKKPLKKNGSLPGFAESTWQINRV